MRYSKSLYLPIHLTLTSPNDTLVFIHELVVRARQLASVAQLVRALHRNRRAAGSIPARGAIVAFFATARGQSLSHVCIIWREFSSGKNRHSN